MVSDGLDDASPAPVWPGFTIDNQGTWYQLRCDNCGKTTSPASLNQALVDGIVRDHRCGPALSTHWSQAVSTGAGYAVMLNSFAMIVEQMPFGVGAEPDVDAGCDRLAQAALSHRRGAADVVDRYDRHERSAYGTLGRPVRSPETAAGEPVVPERPVYVPPPVPAEALTTLGLDDLQGRYDTEAVQALVDDVDDQSLHPPEYITVGELLHGVALPSRPGSGELAVGVVWAPGAMCLMHLAEQLADGRLAEQLAPTEGGVVVYPGDAAPMCSECAAESAAP